MCLPHVNRSIPNPRPQSQTFTIQFDSDYVNHISSRIIKFMHGICMHRRWALLNLNYGRWRIRAILTILQIDDDGNETMRVGRRSDHRLNWNTRWLPVVSPPLPQHLLLTKLRQTYPPYWADWAVWFLIDCDRFPVRIKYCCNTATSFLFST